MSMSTKTEDLINYVEHGLRLKKKQSAKKKSEDDYDLLLT